MSSVAHVLAAQRPAGQRIARRRSVGQTEVVEAADVLLIVQPIDELGVVPLDVAQPNERALDGQTSL